MFVADDRPRRGHGLEPECSAVVRGLGRDVAVEQEMSAEPQLPSADDRQSPPGDESLQLVVVIAETEDQLARRREARAEITERGLQRGQGDRLVHDIAQHDDPVGSVVPLEPGKPFRRVVRRGDGQERAPGPLRPSVAEMGIGDGQGLRTRQPDRAPRVEQETVGEGRGRCGVRSHRQGRADGSRCLETKTGAGRPAPVAAEPWRTTAYAPMPSSKLPPACGKQRWSRV